MSSPLSAVSLLHKAGIFQEPPRAGSPPLRGAPSLLTQLGSTKIPSCSLMIPPAAAQHCILPPATLADVDLGTKLPQSPGNFCTSPRGWRERGWTRSLTAHSLQLLVGHQHVAGLSTTPQGLCEGPFSHPTIIPGVHCSDLKFLQLFELQNVCFSAPLAWPNLCASKGPCYLLKNCV